METTHPSETAGGGSPSLDPNPFSIAPPSKSTKREWGWWPSVLTAIALLAFFAPAYLHHMKLSANPAWYNDDARQQIWSLMRYTDIRLFQNDKVADYYLDCFPILYRQFYHVVGPFWDAKSASKVIPYVLLALTIWCVGQSARRLRGPAAGWAAVALCLGAHVYLDRMAGGLPRTFGFPILALGFLALARGKPLLMAGVTVIGAGFYPSAAMVVGVALTGWLLIPSGWLGKAESWNWGRRLPVLAATALLSVAVMLPTMLSSREYGTTLRATDVKDFPELSNAGRYHEQDSVDQHFGVRAAKNFIDAPLAGIGGKWDPGGNGLPITPRSVVLMVLSVGGLFGYVLLLKNSPPGRRVLLIPAAGILCYLLAVPLYPLLYIPARYQLYPLALAAAVIVPAGLAHLATTLIRHTDQRRTQALFMLASVGPFIVLFTAWNVTGKTRGLSTLSKAGLFEQTPGRGKLYDYLATLKPQSTMIAGWPTDMDDVPYVTGRSVLITYEGHQVFHREYAELMRSRMSSLINALYSTDVTPLIRLARDRGVTHLVVNRKRLYDGEKPPEYFAPYDQAIVERWTELKALRKSHPEITPAFLNPLLKEVSVVFQDNDWMVVDVSQLKADDKKLVK